MSDKLFISADQLQIDSFRLAKKILESGFKPDYIVGLWRGGTPIGISVSEYFNYHGHKHKHTAIRTSRYDDQNNPCDYINISGLEYLIDNANREDSILFIDDVWDEGRTMVSIKKQLAKKMRLNTPENIKVATIYFKPERNQTNDEPDYHLYETNKWIYFPHELMGLKHEMLYLKGSNIQELFDKKNMPEK